MNAPRDWPLQPLKIRCGPARLVLPGMNAPRDWRKRKDHSKFVAPARRKF
jgi:hypothetical protein